EQMRKEHGTDWEPHRIKYRPLTRAGSASSPVLINALPRKSQDSSGSARLHRRGETHRLLLRRIRPPDLDAGSEPGGPCRSLRLLPDGRVERSSLAAGGRDPAFAVEAPARGGRAN